MGGGGVKSKPRTDGTAPAERSQPWTEADLGTTFKLTEEEKADMETWEWSPPDLRPGGEWHNARVTSLEAAIEGKADADQLKGGRSQGTGHTQGKL